MQQKLVSQTKTLLGTLLTVLVLVFALAHLRFPTLPGVSAVHQPCAIVSPAFV